VVCEAYHLAVVRRKACKKAVTRCRRKRDDNSTTFCEGELA
jgi:hypothetical protein